MMRGKLVGGVALVCAVAMQAGCGNNDTGTPSCTTNCTGTASVAGKYMVQLTNGTNGCNFDNWTVGDVTSGVTVEITQSGNSNAVTAAVTGGSGLYLDIALGSHTLTGTVSGSHLALMLNGTRQLKQNNCSYNVIANLAGDVKGDALSGTITYTVATNQSPDCAAIQSCQTLQNFNGTRPPPAP